MSMARSDSAQTANDRHNKAIPSDARTPGDEAVSNEVDSSDVSADDESDSKLVGSVDSFSGAPTIPPRQPRVVHQTLFVPPVETPTTPFQLATNPPTESRKVATKVLKTGRLEDEDGGESSDGSAVSVSRDAHTSRPMPTQSRRLSLTKLEVAQHIGQAEETMPESGEESEHDVVLMLQ